MFEAMKLKKTSKEDVDESSDTYDTVDWLVKNVAKNNGKVGQWGISYPGFYAAAGMIDAHPALGLGTAQAKRLGAHLLSLAVFQSASVEETDSHGAAISTWDFLVY